MYSNMVNEKTGKCALCSLNSTLTCSNCNRVNYCSKECQKNHHQLHKTNCKPFKIGSNKLYGRYLIAARDIKPGELILNERPVVVGPAVTSVPLCLKCFRPISPFKRPCLCEGCNVAPICARSCAGAHHTDTECAEFATNPHISAEKLLQHYQCVMPLRCLLMRKAHKDKWEEFVRMEAHLEQRRNTPIWRNYSVNVEPALRQFNLLTSGDIDGELVQRVCGILDVNTFELRVPGLEATWQQGTLVNCVRGVFLEAALMAHDCLANTHLAVDDQFNMIVHASVPIAKGTPIFFNYTNAMQGTLERQEHLNQGKYFNCNCKRCKDPTECRTYMSSIICVKCRKGLVSPIKSFEGAFSHKARWQCSEKWCNFQCCGSLVKAAVFCAQQLIEETDKSNLRSVEALIRKLLCSFSATHSLILDLKQCLVGLYTEELRAHPNPQRTHLARKLQTCKELIPVLEVVEPGISRLIGITLYEMHVPMVILANREYDSGEINAQELLKKLSQAEEALKKSISYLVYEPTNSPEGRLAAQAITELKLLRKNTANVEKIVANLALNTDQRKKNQKK